MSLQSLVRTLKCLGLGFLLIAMAAEVLLWWIASTTRSAACPSVAERLKREYV